MADDPFAESADVSSAAGLGEGSSELTSENLTSLLPSRAGLLILAFLSAVTIASATIGIMQNNALSNSYGSISKGRQVQMVLLGVALFVGICMFLYGSTSVVTTSITRNRLIAASEKVE